MDVPTMAADMPMGPGEPAVPGMPGPLGHLGVQGMTNVPRVPMLNNEHQGGLDNGAAPAFPLMDDTDKVIANDVMAPMPMQSAENDRTSHNLLNMEDMSPLVCELGAVVTFVENWIIIQHAKFDLSINSEPYHASQVMVNKETKEFIVRVWGKTFKKGVVSGIAELRSICQSALGRKTVCCPGHYSEGLSALFFNMPRFTLVTHPFKRYVSAGCKVLYEKHDSTDYNLSEYKVKLCSSCSSLKQEQQDLAASGGAASVKQESIQLPLQPIPSDFLELGYGIPGLPPAKPRKNKNKPRKVSVSKTGKGEKVKCDKCGEEFPHSFQMRTHLIQRHLWGLFTCHICLFVLFHPDELSSHLREKHSDANNASCAKCPSCKEDVYMEDGKSLAEHYSKCSLMDPKVKREMAEQKKKNEKIVCETCGLELRSRQALTNHMYRHTGEYPFRCDFEDCGKGFRHKAALKSHKEKHEREITGEPAPKKAMCELCGKTFGDKTYLKEHVIHAHEKKSMDIKCTECPMVFVRRVHMMKHRNLVHFPDRHRCQVCHKSFGNGEMLRKHQAVHNPEGQYECDVCGSRIKSKASLVEHMRIHRGEKPYPCPYCDYRGTSSSLLYHHKNRAHKAELDLEYQEKEKSRIKVSAEVQQRAAADVIPSFSDFDIKPDHS